MNYRARSDTISAPEQENRWLSGNALSSRPALGFAAAMTSYRRGEPIRMRTGPGECWGRIVHGAARLCVPQNAGHRRIIDFLLPGDMTEPAACGVGSDLEALCDGTVVVVYRNRGGERTASDDPYVPREMRELSLAMASRFRRQILILGHNTAMGKLCAFLLEMQKRSADNQPDTIVLAMSRYDIADYLAISPETVSRSLTVLQARKAIKQIHKRHIKILDRDALENGLFAN